MTDRTPETTDAKVAEAFEAALEDTVPDYDAPQGDLTARTIMVFLRRLHRDASELDIGGRIIPTDALADLAALVGKAAGVGAADAR